jgi:hypothetical protein
MPHNVRACGWFGLCYCLDMTKQIFLKHLRLARNAENLPSYYSEQVFSAIQAKVFTADELQSVIKAECFNLNGDLAHSEVLECFERIKKAVVI